MIESKIGSETMSPSEIRLRREHDALVQIGKALTSTLDLPEVLEIIMAQVSRVLEPKTWSLLMVDEQTGELYFEIAVSPAAEKIKDQRLKVGEGIAGWVAQFGKPLLIGDVTKDERFDPQIDAASGFKTRSIICVPMLCKNRITGVIELINSFDDNTFTDSDLTLLAAIADFAAIAIENARNFAHIQQLVITDELTGLYNAGFLLESLEYEIARAKRYDSDLSLIFLDLDYFKNVNDSQGHLVGSRLLAEIGELLKNSIRKSDMAARYGGDEFVIVLPNTPKEGAKVLAYQLRNKLNEYTFLNESGNRINVTASLGLASYPADASDKLTLVQKADAAMYAAKDAGRNAVKTA